MTIKSMTIEIEASQLLSCIWYSDGSGSQFSVDTYTCPSDYVLSGVQLRDDGFVELRLKAKPAGAPADGGGE